MIIWSPVSITNEEWPFMNIILHRLKLVHARLESEIRRELKARWPDRERVSRLKKLKLAIKDRLHGTARRTIRVG
jgi:uncharacterized protein